MQMDGKMNRAGAFQQGGTDKRSETKVGQDGDGHRGRVSCTFQTSLMSSCNKAANVSSRPYEGGS